MQSWATSNGLINAVQIATLPRERSCSAVSAAALVGRTNSIAFVVDTSFRLQEANQAALEAFYGKDPVACRAGFIRHSSPTATKSLKNLLNTQTNDLTFNAVMNLESGQWLVCINRLPGGDQNRTAEGESAVSGTDPPVGCPRQTC